MDTKKGFDQFIVDRTLIIKDPEVFKIAYTPEQIVERKESSDFYREIATFINYRKPNHVLIKGPPGTGKTVTINFVLRRVEILREDIQVFGVNCAAKKDIDILNILNNEHGKNSFHQQIKYFLENLKKDALIVFDEIDRSHYPDALLYYLSRPKEILKSFDKNISLVLISNNLNWEEYLKDGTRSSLQLKTVVFAPYNANKLKEIIKKRVKLGFHNESAISDELIGIISEETAKRKRGDCRVAIESIFYAAQNAEMKNRKNICFDDVKSALKLVMQSIDKERIGKLKDNQLIVLYCTLVKDKDITLQSFYQAYLDIIKNISVKRQSHISIYHILDYLDDLGLIDKSVKVIKLPNKTPKRMMHLEPNIDDSIVFDELGIRDIRLSRRRDE